MLLLQYNSLIRYSLKYYSNHFRDAFGYGFSDRNKPFSQMFSSVFAEKKKSAYIYLHWKTAYMANWLVKDHVSH